MSRFFFGCFRAKDKRDDQTPFGAVHPASAAITKARVSKHQLSDLFVSQEAEELLRDEKSTQPELDTLQCKDMRATKVVDWNKQPVQPQTPAKPSELEKGLDSLEETPTSCVSGLSNASRNSVSTAQKSEKGNFPSSITHPYHTNKETLASQNLSASGNECESDASSSSISPTLANAHRSYNQDGFDVPDNKRCPLHKEELRVKANLTRSSALKPAPQNKHGNKTNFKAELASCDHTGRTQGDKPILGHVGAQWNKEVDPSPIPVKWWDGNGIPNSTNKYREDQIVSWHATPFEEMLEKALSEENSISQSLIGRKQSKSALVPSEDETDTAASQLPSLCHPKSVVSF